MTTTKKLKIVWVTDPAAIDAHNAAVAEMRQRKAAQLSPDVGVMFERPNRARQTRITFGVMRTIGAMRAGASLHCSFERGRQLWKLSTGPFIAKEIAEAVIRDPAVTGVGDALFDGVTSQTYRFTESPHGQ